MPKDTPSARLLGITVRSTDTDDKRKVWGERNEPYYAEVLFNGDPTK
jgi:hypothetical protein